jgi:hypothetical protein
MDAVDSLCHLLQIPFLPVFHEWTPKNVFRCLDLKMVLRLCVMLFFAIHVSCCSVVCCKTNQDSSRTVSVMTFFCYTSVPLFCFKYHISLLNKSYNTIKDKNCHSVLWEQQSYQHMYPSPLLLIKFVVILGEF